MLRATNLVANKGGKERLPISTAVASNIGSSPQPWRSTSVVSHNYGAQTSVVRHGRGAEHRLIATTLARHAR
jgi:hypothetical protein